jgi:hypothetical protein
LELVKYDKQSGAYVDEKRKHFVKASLIRKHAKKAIGARQVKGRLSAKMVEAYWLDKFKEAVKYEL